MKSLLGLLALRSNQHGGVYTLVAVAMVVLLGLGALAVDLAHLYLARNELQNAADAGALAGARFLYTCGGVVNDSGFTDDCGIGPGDLGTPVWIPSANKLGYDAAIANKSQKTLVEVIWPGGNDGDVQRGHWSFATRTFTPNPNTSLPNLFLLTWDEIDARTDFINAVKVTARRETISIVLYLARILGIDSVKLRADAVAYIGFAGDSTVSEFDQPIVICRTAVWNEETNTPDCRTGRMINSDQKREESWNTGGWTDYVNFDSESDCSGSASANDIRPLVCNTEGNTDDVTVNSFLQVTGGEVESAMAVLRNCWRQPAIPDGEGGYTGGADAFGNDSIPDVPWGMRVPVVSCLDNNLTTCAQVVGAIDLVILWITEAGEDPEYLNIPREMEGWDGCAVAIPGYDDSNLAHRQDCWENFAENFELKDLGNPDSVWAEYKKKSIYVKMSCDFENPSGGTGGEFFGVLAKIPKLVE